jgi:putative ABC transport system permease protein
MRREQLIDELRQDLRVGLRGLRRSPIHTLTILASVGLGIGAATVMFALVNTTLLRPLPYENPERLVRIYTDAHPNKFPFSVADYLGLEEQHKEFEQVAGFSTQEMAFTDGAIAERVPGKRVSWTYFEVLGITPSLGRPFSEADGRPGAPPAVIVSNRFWQQYLGGRTDVIGRPIRLDGVDTTLAGVLPRQIGPLDQARDVFVAAQWTTPPRRGPFFITALARIRAGASGTAATSELRAINRAVFTKWSGANQTDRTTWSMVDLKTFVLGDVGPRVGVTMAAVGLIWLIACVNSANLLVARVTGRRRELAVRAALGASRHRVVRYLLSETVILAAGAAVLGNALAWGGIAMLREFGGTYIPRTQEIAFDGGVLSFLAAATVASAFIFGLIPAVHGIGGAVDQSLRASGRSSTGNSAVRRVRQILVASQFAVATPLLIAAGLLVASLNELSRVDIGFDTRNLLTGSIQLPAAQYPDQARVVAFWTELRQRVAALPGITGIAFSDSRPPNEPSNLNDFDLEQFPTPTGQPKPVAPWLSVTPEYFQVLSLKLEEGRLLNQRDLTGDTVIVVDRAWARRYFPNESAVGKRLRSGGCTTCEWTTVVGVVGDVKYTGLGNPDQGAVYAPRIGRSEYLVLRTGAAPSTVLPMVRQAVRDMDPALPLSRVATIDELVSQQLQTPRVLSILVSAFAIVALILSSVGIYGVMAYYVEQNSKDISIRLALGGSPSDVLRMVVGQGIGVVAAGVIVGLVAAVAVTRFASSLLFGVSAADPFTFVATAGVLLGMALLACGVPARRAVSIQPASVLRND